MSEVSRLAVVVDAQLGSSVSKLKGVESQFWRTTSAAKAADAQISKSGRNVAKSTVLLNGATKGMAIGAGVAMAVSAKAAVDWESAFTGVRKTIDGSEAEFKALESGLRGMATQIPVSATALAQIAETAGQLGIKKKNILDFTRVVADMGVATNLVGEEGASTMAKFANITGMSQGNFERLGSTIVALGNSGASTEADIAAMGLRIAAAGKQVGMSEADTLGYANALSSVGVEAEAGGTAISRVLKAMSTDVRKGGKDLELMAQVSGQSTAAFKKNFEQDAAGAAQKFLAGLGKMQKSGGDVLGVLEALKFDDVRVSDSVLRLAGNAKVLGESLDTAKSSWQQNSALAEEANRRYATTASQLQILKNHAIEAGISLGTAFLPTINTAARLGVSLLHSQAAMDALAIAAGALGGRMVALGAAWSVGQVVAFAGALRSVGAAFSLMRGAMATGTLLTQLPALFTLAGGSAAALLGPIGLIAGGAAVAAISLGIFSSKNDDIARSANIATAALQVQKAAFDALNTATTDRDALRNQRNSLDTNINQMRGQRGAMEQGPDRSALNAQIKVMVDQRNDLSRQLAEANAKVEAEANKFVSTTKKNESAAKGETSRLNELRARTDRTNELMNSLAGLDSQQGRTGASSKGLTDKQKQAAAAAVQNSQAIREMGVRYAKVPKLVTTKIKTNNQQTANELNGLTKRLDGIKGKSYTAKILAKASGAEEAIKLVKAALDAADKKDAKAKVSAPGAKAAKGDVDALKGSINALPAEKTTRIKVIKTESKGRASGGRVGAYEPLTEVNERGAEGATYPDGSFGMLGDGRRGIVSLPQGTIVHTSAETSRMLRDMGIDQFAGGGKKGKKAQKRRDRADKRAQRMLGTIDFLNATGRLSDEAEAKKLKAVAGIKHLPTATKRDARQRLYELQTGRQSSIKDAQAQGQKVGASAVDAAVIERDMAKRHLDEAKRAKDAQAVAQAEAELKQATHDLASAQRQSAIENLDAGVALARLTPAIEDDIAAFNAQRDFWTQRLNELRSDSIDDRTQGAQIAEAANNIASATESLKSTAESMSTTMADLKKSIDEQVALANKSLPIQRAQFDKWLTDAIVQRGGQRYGQRGQTAVRRQGAYVGG